MAYDLYYWPGIPGRGEYVRLVLEAAGADYREMARLPESEGGGVDAMTAIMDARDGPRAPFAPPFLKMGEIVISQAAECAAYVGEREGLAPTAEADRLFCRAVAYTTADLVAEAHDLHHPLGVGLYYEDQKAEAARRAEGFRNERLPKFLDWYENLIADNPSGSIWLVGDRMTYADLGLFQTLAGLAYALPRRMAALEPEYANIVALAGEVARHPKVAAYLASPRRLSFNENGIFRHYPELDGD